MTGSLGIPPEYLERIFEPLFAPEEQGNRARVPRVSRRPFGVRRWRAPAREHREQADKSRRQRGRDET